VCVCESVSNLSSVIMCMCVCVCACVCMHCTCVSICVCFSFFLCMRVYQIFPDSSCVCVCACVRVCVYVVYVCLSVYFFFFLCIAGTTFRGKSYQAYPASSRGAIFYKDIVGLFCRDIGLFCRDIGFFCGDVILFCKWLFPSRGAIFYRDIVGLFCRVYRALLRRCDALLQMTFFIKRCYILQRYHRALLRRYWALLRRYGSLLRRYGALLQMILFCGERYQAYAASSRGDMWSVLQIS